MRRVRAKAAHAALARAEEAARWARIPALAAEVEHALAVLDTPAARLIARGDERPVLLEEVEALLASKARLATCRVHPGGRYGPGWCGGRGGDVERLARC
jgi:hypothetical protein